MRSRRPNGWLRALQSVKASWRDVGPVNAHRWCLPDRSAGYNWPMCAVEWNGAGTDLLQKGLHLLLGGQGRDGPKALYRNGRCHVCIAGCGKEVIALR